MSAFLGMRGTGDWTTDERPTNFRQGILYLEPNGMSPITAMNSRMKSQSVDDAQFSHWEKERGAQGGAALLYTSDALSTAVTTQTFAVGDYGYLKMAEALAKEFREGHVVGAVDASDITKGFTGIVTLTVLDGDSSYLKLRNLKAVAASGAAGIDYGYIIGSASAEGANMPEAVAYNPTKYYNYTQILRSPLEISRTAFKTRLRTVNSYDEAKKDALRYHGQQLEECALFGVRTEGTDPVGGKLLRTSGGIKEYIADNSPAANLATFSGTWLGTGISNGEGWLDSKLAELFKWGSSERIAYCGNTALLAIQRLAKVNAGSFNFTSKTTSYGIKVVEWVTPFGTVNLRTHPLFNLRADTQATMLIMDPSNIKFRYITDTMYKSDDSYKKGGQIGADAIREEYLTEAGWELFAPKEWMWLAGIEG